MLRSAAKSAGYPGAETFDLKDEKEFRKLASWLEECGIVSSKPGGSTLKNVNSSSWDQDYEKFLKTEPLGCPVFGWFTPESSRTCTDQRFREATMTWLLGQAVKANYSQRASELNEKALAAMMGSDRFGSDAGPVKRTRMSSNPIENLDFQSEDFKEGVKRLAVLLKVNSSHPDHLITLEACCKLISQRLSAAPSGPAGKAKAGDSAKGESFKLADHDFGVPKDVKDPVLAEAIKILRLTHLHRLRDLQSDINATIEVVQAATADPKTDTRLGKVGR